MAVLGLSEDQTSALRRAAANSGYHLLLGAGASLDSRSVDGSNLPGAASLAREMSRSFTVPIEDDDLLWRVYARAVEKHGRDFVYAWLRKRFAMVEPPNWMDAYARFPWECVWTLNLDDSFERSYERVATETSRRLLSLSWDDEFKLSRDLNIVHLHGHVLDAGARALVFSLSEYADAAVSRAAWPLAFRDTYGVSPMVIIGARLRDEPDIEAVVGRRLPEHDAPSFYVSPHISAAAEADLRAWRLVPVKATAEEFSSTWAELTGLSLTTAPSRAEELALRLGRQFLELTTNKAVKLPKGHDLLGGDEPRWDDVRVENHAELQWIGTGVSLVRRVGKAAPSGSALVFVGKRLTGRSTGLLALAHEFRRQAWRVFLYRRDERPDVDAVLQFASDGKPMVLVFDGFADIAEDVALILKRGRQARLPIMVVATDQIERSAGIVGRLSKDLLVNNTVYSINAKLNAVDAARLVDKLQSAGRLGRIESLKNDRGRRSHFQGNELFASMAALEDAPGFGRRVGAEVQAISSDEQLHLLFLASISARVGRRLYLVDAAQMMRRPSEELVRLIREDRMASVLTTDGRIVGARRRWLALQPVIDRLGQHRALVLLSDGIQALSSRVSRSSQRERNAASLLVGSLMAYRNLAEIFPGANFEAWYASIFNSFGNWSGRYWEQRAIMSRHLGEVNVDALARAESYAQRAITLREDTYSYTTLGTVLAARGAKADLVTLGEYYDRTFDAFERASQLDPQNIVTWLAFLSHSLKILERLAREGDRDELWDRLTEDWLRIFDSVAQTLSAADEPRSELTRLKARYRALVA